MTERDLILEYKKDFFSKTGKQIDVVILNKWQSKCRLSDKIPMETIVFMILDVTGWDFKEMTMKNKERKNVFKRYLTYFILHNNGYSLTSIGKFFGCDHTTVIHGLSEIENELELNKYVDKLFSEIVDYLRLNSPTFIDRKLTREDLFSLNNQRVVKSPS